MTALCPICNPHSEEATTAREYCDVHAAENQAFISAIVARDRHNLAMMRLSAFPVIRDERHPWAR